MIKSVFRSMFFAGLVLAPVLASADPIGIKDAHEIYYGLATATEVSPADPITAAYFAQVLGRLPRDGKVDEANSPMQFAFVNLAGLFCSRFIDREAQETNPERRLVHRNVDFLLDLKGFDGDTARSVIDGYFRIFLGRNSLPEEMQVEVDAMADYVATAGTKANLPELLTLLCSATASSPEFLLF